MTILTKAFSEKKNSEKVPLPLGIVLGDAQDEVAMLHALKGKGTLIGRHGPTSPSFSDVDAESMVFNRPPFSCVKSLLLFLVSLIVMMMGILGGYTLYRMYMPTHKTLHMRAFCDIPYASRSNLTYPRFYTQPDGMDWNWRNMLPASMQEDTFGDLPDDNFFREEFDLDTSDEDGFAKIDVPDFKDGRRGRFMHDFKENQSAIIDTTTNRCFIMSLDRDTTLPPKNFLDLMQKMGSGYYNIDTDRVRRRMRVVVPPITDLTLISERIANECYDMKVYMLENYVSGVFKREAKLITDAGKFAEFMGKGIVEFDLLNIADIEEYERQLQK